MDDIVSFTIDTRYASALFRQIGKDGQTEDIAYDFLGWAVVQIDADNETPSPIDGETEDYELVAAGPGVLVPVILDTDGLPKTVSEMMAEDETLNYVRLSRTAID